MTESPRALLGFAWRLLRRDMSSGRLVVMLLAVVIAVTSTVSVNLIVARVQSALSAESSALLAADIAISSSRPDAGSYAALANRLGLQQANTLSMRSVTSAGTHMQLVRLKAVSDSYPLRGELVVETAKDVVRQAHPGPARGEVLADRRLLHLLDIDIGTNITIGNVELRLSGVLLREPDRGRDLFALAPRVLMNKNDLAASGLIVPGTRAKHSMLFAGSVNQVAQFEQQLKLREGDRLLEPRSARPETASAFTQAERFLALAVFAGVLLATVGVALAAHAFSSHHEQTLAILKTLGMRVTAVRAVMFTELSLLALLGGVGGNLLALGIHHLLITALLPSAVPPFTIHWLAVLHGMALAYLILLGFALPPLYRAAALPVTQILGQNRQALRAGNPRQWLIMGIAALAIAPWYSGNPKLIAITFAGMASAAVLTAGFAWLLVRIISRMRARTHMSWRFGLANIARRARLSVVQTTALGLGLAVLLLLGLIRDDLIVQWQSRVPADAPNQFLINIQASDVPAVERFLAAFGLAKAQLYPMIRGRLSAINEQAVDPDTYADARAQRLAAREFNLSYATEMKADNRLEAGQWWSPTASGEISIEQGIAETLGIELGDTLEFNIAGQSVSGRITNIRAVSWDNFEVNFFVVMTPDLLRQQPATFITSFYLSADKEKVMPALVKQFPSVTVIDVDALMAQVRDIMDRVAGALAWVFAFALAAGLLVIAAAVQASQHERVADLLLLKTLGAERRFMLLSAVLEFSVIGLLAGTIAGIAALVTGWGIAAYVLEISYVPSISIVVLGVVAGVVGISLLGYAVARNAHSQLVAVGLRQV